MGRPPDEDRAEWERDSPLSQAAQVKAPTLVFAGVHNFLPWQLSQQFHDTINAAGTKADFYLFAHEGHGLRQAASQFAAAQVQLEWFRKYLKND